MKRKVALGLARYRWGPTAAIRRTETFFGTRVTLWALIGTGPGRAQLEMQGSGPTLRAAFADADARLDLLPDLPEGRVA